MVAVNRSIVAGNLTRDIEVKFTQGGLAIAEVGLAINEKRKDASGNYVDDVCYVEVTIFGKTAETAAKYLSKGTPVMFEARLKQDKWKDKTSGENRYKLKLICEKMHFLGGGKGGGGRQSGDESREYSNPAGGAIAGDDEDPIPF